MTITLYDLPELPHARKVRLLAAELGIPLDCVRCDPRTGETRTPNYLAKNPNGKVPTLVEDDFVLWESPAILKYLAAKHPERKLAGTDAKQAAQIDQWLFWWGCGAEAAIDALAWELLIKPKVLNQPGNDPGIIADAHTRINRFLPVLDKQLGRPRATSLARCRSPTSPSARASTVRPSCSNSTSRLTGISAPG